MPVEFGLTRAKFFSSDLAWSLTVKVILIQDYEVKRGLAKASDLNKLLCDAFGTCQKDGDWFATSFGAMPMIKAKYEGTKLVVDTQNDTSLASKVAKGDAAATQLVLDTQKRWNEFLLNATGFDAKQRGKNAQKAAKKG